MFSDVFIHVDTIGICLCVCKMFFSFMNKNSLKFVLHAYLINIYFTAGNRSTRGKHVNTSHPAHASKFNFGKNQNSRDDNHYNKRQWGLCKRLLFHSRTATRSVIGRSLPIRFGNDRTATAVTARGGFWATSDDTVI
jgi:hypothetical protein